VLGKSTSDPSDRETQNPSSEAAAAPYARSARPKGEFAQTVLSPCSCRLRVPGTRPMPIGVKQL
jgi:hypothetical protein